jgi:F420-dependent oxidoreductase-like protein
VQHYGVTILPQYTTWPDLRETALVVERLGYDSLWTWDHFQPILGHPQGPNLEGWQILAAWAALTHRVRLGLLVSGNTYRHPAVLAKMAATLDHVSKGRAILGMGAAWCPSEHQEYGLEFGTAGERVARLAEALPIIRSLLDQPRTTFVGRYYQVRDALAEPKPLQPRLPLMLGAAGEQKMLRLVAQYADYWNAFGPAEVMGRKTNILRQYCREVGTDFGQILTTVTMSVIIRDTDEALKARRDQIQAHHRIGKWRPNHVPLSGSPRVVAEALFEYWKVGIRGIVVGMPAPFDTETLERMQSDVRPLLDKMVRRT